MMLNKYIILKYRILNKSNIEQNTSQIYIYVNVIYNEIIENISCTLIFFQKNQIQKNSDYIKNKYEDKFVTL